jgi:hypothetical protein
LNLSQRASHLSPKQNKQAAILAAIAAWRYNQGIYRFQRDVYKKIIHCSLQNKFNPSIFYRLPEWSIYVKTPHLTWNNTALAGFWCHLEWNEEDNRPILKFVLNSFKLHIILLPLDKRVLNELYKPTKTRATQGGGIRVPFNDVNYSPLFVMVALVYFICKSSAQIGSKGKHPNKVQPKLFKGVLKLFPVNQPTLWNIDFIS